MVGFYEELLPYIKTTKFPDKKSSSNCYFYLNPAFSYADGIIFSSILRHFKPSRVIEIGSGYSSACILDTRNNFLDESVSVDFIEPYPDLLDKLIGDKKLINISIHRTGIQEVDPDLFAQLRENDILFIDSTHIMKTGSDVNHILFNIIPLLNSGVIIHFHDIFWPFEYPLDWIFKENRSWNEIYALRSFLMYNNNFDILFFNDFFINQFHERIKRESPQLLKNTGGSFYLKKTH
jgi:predicted O-methyltransferase YrrM